MPYGGMVFPDTEPEEMDPSMELPPVGSEQKAPDTTVPITTSVPPSTLAPLLWGKGDPPTSIMGKWPCLLRKTKTGLRPWHQVYNINVVKFQNVLQIARVTKGTERTFEQLVIINRMNKHKKGTSSCQYQTSVCDTDQYCKGTCRSNAAVDNQRVRVPPSDQTIA